MGNRSDRRWARRGSRRGGRRRTDPPKLLPCLLALLAWSVLGGLVVGGVAWLMITAAQQWTPLSAGEITTGAGDLKNS